MQIDLKATEEDIESFTCGDCWILAQEIERATGCPAYAYWNEGVYDHHVWVKVGNKRLDIKGLRSAKEFDAEWFGKDDDPMAVKRMDWAVLEYDWGDKEMFTGSRRRARVLAKRVAKSL